PCTMIILQRFLHNQGDAWEYTLDTLERAIQHSTVAEAMPVDAQPAEVVDPEEELRELATMLGKRLGELHHVLATPTELPDFAPQEANDDDVRQWQQAARQQLEAAFDILRNRQDWGDSRDAECAQRLLAQREALLSAVEELALAGLGSKRIRI